MPTPNQYDIGDVSVITAKFFTALGAPAAPTVATIRVRDPAGAETSYAGGQLGNPSTGVYTYSLSLTQSGTYYYRGVGTGSVIAAAEGSLRVRATAFAAP